MNDIQIQLIEFLDKAYQLTRLALKQVQEKNYDQLNTLLDNRERALNIVQSLTEKLALYQENSKTPIASITEFNSHVNLIIEKIANIDDIITSCLTHEKEKTQFEIAKTFKNKENFKGYNLNNTK